MMDHIKERLYIYSFNVRMMDHIKERLYIYIYIYIYIRLMHE